MLAATQTGTGGERYVVRWLDEEGYSASVDTGSPASEYVVGRGNGSTLLVRVKSAVEPNVPAPLSEEELLELKTRSRERGFEPWEARVQLNRELRQVGEVVWKKHI